MRSWLTSARPAAAAKEDKRADAVPGPPTSSATVSGGSGGGGSTYSSADVPSGSCSSCHCARQLDVKNTVAPFRGK